MMETGIGRRVVVRVIVANIRSAKGLAPSDTGLAFFRGKMTIMAGSITTVYKNASITPIGATQPSWAMIATSANAKESRPLAVVTLVISTGRPAMPIVWIMACRLSAVFRYTR